MAAWQAPFSSAGVELEDAPAQIGVAREFPSGLRHESELPDRVAAAAQTGKNHLAALRTCRVPMIYLHHLDTELETNTMHAHHSEKAMFDSRSWFVAFSSKN
mmetsp:Transcript_19019/g.36632  ORF Transcript_19019/g.36632 Transcript_19019/m.36632 type:complete len:102 (+) Transcript_19019:281-586(+)